jgi:hypothetical protein
MNNRGIKINAAQIRIWIRTEKNRVWDNKGLFIVVNSPAKIGKSCILWAGNRRR